MGLVHQSEMKVKSEVRIQNSQVQGSTSMKLINLGRQGTQLQ